MKAIFFHRALLVLVCSLLPLSGAVRPLPGSLPNILNIIGKHKHNNVTDKRTRVLADNPKPPNEGGVKASLDQTGKFNVNENPLYVDNFGCAGVGVNVPDYDINENVNDIFIAYYQDTLVPVGDTVNCILQCDDDSHGGGLVSMYGHFGNDVNLTNANVKFGGYAGPVYSGRDPTIVGEFKCNLGFVMTNEGDESLELAVFVASQGSALNGGTLKCQLVPACNTASASTTALRMGSSNSAAANEIDEKASVSALSTALRMGSSNSSTTSEVNAATNETNANALNDISAFAANEKNATLDYNVMSGPITMASGQIYTLEFPDKPAGTRVSCLVKCNKDLDITLESPVSVGMVGFFSGGPDIDHATAYVYSEFDMCSAGVIVTSKVKHKFYLRFGAGDTHYDAGATVKCTAIESCEAGYMERVRNGASNLIAGASNYFLNFWAN